MYVNPGYLALVEEDFELECQEVSSATYNPTNNVALIGGFLINKNNFSPINIYLKFDIYKDDSDIILDYNGLKGNVGRLEMDSNGIKFSYTYGMMGSNWQEYQIPKSVLKDNDINHFFLHIDRGVLEEDESSDDWRYWINGSLELIINDYSISESLKKTFNNNLPNISGNFSFYSESPISNFIISNETIDKEEQVINLPISATDTDMTNNNGIYTANIEDQYILQTIDAASLITKFGAKSEVKKILVVGAPAYKVSGELSTITSIEKTNEHILEYDSETLLISSNSIVQFEHTMNATLIKDLAGKAYGFKVGV